MGSHRRLLRLSAWLAATSLSLSFTPSWSQPAPPGGAEQAGDENTDPPALAGRLSQLVGSVSFHAAGETQWAAATLNYPVTNGLSFWTEPRGSAAMEIADSRLVMDESTELDVTALDQGEIAATEPQGALFLQLNTVPSSQGVSFSTPRGTVQITASGRYEVVAGDTNNATLISVVDGAAHVSGPGLSLDIGPQQTATIGGSDTLQGNVGPLQQDAFLQSQLSQPAPQPSAALPRQTRYMTGASDLQQYGSFTQSAQYGAVWYPRDVAQDWAPYRDGHWAYVQPWGWTWVDNARWGFAPFHYGRWVQVDNRWGWVAGGGDADYADAYPVYSPALVTFVDVGGAALAGAALGFAAGELSGGYAPAWIPLGPREPYYPWYHARAAYFGRINGQYGVPREIIARGPTYVTNINQTNIFINRRAATVIPASAFARGVSMRGIARPLPERALLQARPVIGRLPVRPTAFTPNLPPAAARRFNVALPPRPVRPIAAGPRILPPASGARTAPALRPAALPGNLRPQPVPGNQPRPGLTGPGGVRPAPGGPAPRPGVESGQPRPNSGPVIGARPGGLPPLRAPGATRPESLPPGGMSGVPPRGGVAPPGRAPAGMQPDRAGARPGQASTPLRPDAGHPGQTSQPRPERPGAAESRLPTRPAAGSLPPAGATRPARIEPPRPDRAPAARPASPPRPETARPAPRPEAARPVPRPEAARPAPRPEASRPAPRPETPRPAAPPRAEAPRPPPPRPMPQPPRPAPRPEAPRPAPRPEAPRPQPPAPRPAPQPHPGPHKPGEPSK